MEIQNNSFSLDNIASLMYRLRLLKNSIISFSDELAISDDELDNMMNVIDSLFDLAGTEHVEKADVKSIYAGLREEEAKARKALFSCRKLLRGEFLFADKSTVDYIEERFLLAKKVPKGRSEFIDMAENMIESFDTIGEELPGLTLPALPFDRLRDQMESMKGFLDQVQRERAERKAATARLRHIRGECVKLLRWVYLRAVSHWGNDDPRLLQLGMVDKSGIWTKKKSKPPEAEG